MLKHEPAAPWYSPRHDGQGHWKPTPRANPVATVVDVAVFTIALTLALTVLIALVAIGRTAMCSAYDNAISYCPGYTPTTSTETTR